jgi:phosphoribosylaminoimidazole-succinocarboxamide synthase
VIWLAEGPGARGAGGPLVDALIALGFDAALATRDRSPAPGERVIEILEGRETDAARVERVLACVPVDFDALPLLADGDSKEVRLWTERVVLMRFKPTVYSFTTNRYGEVPGTDLVRLRFTTALFRSMARPRAEGGTGHGSAFLGVVEAPGGPLLAERRVDPGNLEIRIKRYHIGSPVHRYRFTERHRSVRGAPIGRWSRFNEPVVCFDWRHPLRDENGVRLADEPLSDDYARVWMADVDHAKAMSREVFLWMEELFAQAGVRLVDMCLFVDRTGRVIFGEVSPDCMRSQLTLDDPARADSADKDLWRTGKAPELLLARYESLYRRIFGTGS